MIFRGRDSGGRHKKTDEDRRADPRRSSGGSHSTQPGSPAEPAEGAHASGVGPYDITEAPDGVERLDLGSLKIPAIEGVEVRVQAANDGVITQVVLVHGESALELGVFAAPRNTGIWDEVREEIRRSLSEQGVKAQELDGEYGKELLARIRGPEGSSDVRFIGVDGPRWMVRAVYQGRAAVDPAAAGPLADCLHGLVVDRGREAMPVREALPLRLPREAVEQRQAEQAQQEAQAGTAARDGSAPPSANGASGGPTGNARSSPRPRRSQ